MYYIHLLPASFGDAILIEYGDTSKKYILIDGGPYFNFEILEKSIQKIAPDLKTLELLVVTHIDIDHIDGVIMLLNQKKIPFAIKEIWYNGFEEMQTQQMDILGVVQGEYLTALIKEKNIPHNTKFNGKAIVVKDYNHLPEITLADGMVLTLLGPNIQGLEAMREKWKVQTKDIGDEATILKRLQVDKRYEEQIDDLLGDLSLEDLQNTLVKADKSEANGSSIAFVATYKNKSCLLVGDLFTDHLQKGIDALIKKRGTKKLVVDAWKLAHHGSKKSTLETLMQKIETKNILISSDGKRYHHPDKETIAKLIKNINKGITFYFNYKTAHNDMWSDTNLQTHYHFKSIYPKNETENGISIKLL
jgi:beta-lactamase superfamily II metal-dependent hydrolase